MTEVGQSPAQALLRLINGYQVSQAIHAAAILKVADLIDDAPVDAADIAASVGADPSSLYRLLRALATVGIFEETADRRFVATPMSQLLRTGRQGSLHGWAAMIGGPMHWQSWGTFVESARDGRDSFDRRFGKSVWDVRAEDPETVRLFSAAMASLTGAVSAAVIDAIDFNRFDTIVDIGGADGAFLIDILARSPNPRGVVFDLPHVVAAATSRIESAHLGARCTTAAGSYFESIPAGADAYLSKSVLHDCPDSDCVRILRNVRAAIAPGGSVLIVEAVLGVPPSPPDAFSDLNMLVNNGGRERRLDEWEELFARGGFALEGITRTASRFSVIEGRPTA